MSKPFLMISCPIDTYSGYGARSRDIVRALLKTEKYDVKILPQRWGACPFGALKKDNPEDLKLLQRIVQAPNGQLPRQPDIWIQVTVPNEFQAIGKYNIGITAGIETTICDPSWIEGLNRMNLNLVSSNHAKSVFQNSKFEKRDNNTNQLIEMIELKKPIEVLFEGADLTKYFKTDEVIETKINDKLNSIQEDFCFLFVGHWLQGTLGEDRKNVGMLIKIFLETFKNKKTMPALILKTSGAGSSIIDRDNILQRIDEIRKTVKGTLPNIYLLHGEISDSEINQLYNHKKVKAMINLTKGEGFGRPLLEFSLMQKPMIVSAWSGHCDFLNPEFSLMVKGEIKQIHQSAVIPNMLIAESGWFTPDYPTAGLFMKDVFENYNNYLEKAKRQSYRSKTQFSLDEMGKKLDNLLVQYLPEFPKQVELKLPQIKKISLPKKVEEQK